MAWIAQAVGGALGTIGTIFANVSADKARKRLQALEGVDPDYQQSPYAKQRLALAQATLNSRASGAAAFERNVAQTQANTNASVNRNATDSSQAIAAAMAGQGAANDAYGDLAVLEEQAGEVRQQRLAGAQDEMTKEHQADFDDNVRRWQDKVNIAMGRHALRQQQGQNLVALGGMIGGMNFGGGGGGAAGGAAGGK